jgi:hypothetical protein
VALQEILRAVARAAWAEGGPHSHRASLTAGSIIGAFFAGMLATAFILLALG